MFLVMPFVKKAKSSTVHVETKKMWAACGEAKCFCKMPLCHLVWWLLLLANLVVLIVFLCTYIRTETMKVWWSDNYKLVKQIYKTEAFKNGQTQQIQQALQMYKTTTPQLQQGQEQPQIQLDTSTQ